MLFVPQLIFHNYLNFGVKTEKDRNGFNSLLLAYLSLPLPLFSSDLCSDRKTLFDFTSFLATICPKASPTEPRFAFHINFNLLPFQAFIFIFFGFLCN